jgi:U3 small nucleolar RNA-associated protein 14
MIKEALSLTNDSPVQSLPSSSITREAIGKQLRKGAAIQTWLAVHEDTSKDDEDVEKAASSKQKALRLSWWVRSVG